MVKPTGPSAVFRVSAEDRGYGLDGTAEANPDYLTLYNEAGDRLDIDTQDLAAVGDMLIRAFVRTKRG